MYRSIHYTLTCFIGIGILVTSDYIGAWQRGLNVFFNYSMVELRLVNFSFTKNLIKQLART